MEQGSGAHLELSSALYSCEIGSECNVFPVDVERPWDLRAHNEWRSAKSRVGGEGRRGGRGTHARMHMNRA